MTQFTVRAVEAALDGLTPERVREVAERSREAGRKLDVAMERAQEVLDDPVLYRCPNDCDPAWRPRSPSARCPSCGRTAIAT